MCRKLRLRSNSLLKNSKLGRRCAIFDSKACRERLFRALSGAILNQCCALTPSKTFFRKLLVTFLHIPFPEFLENAGYFLLTPASIPGLSRH